MPVRAKNSRLAKLTRPRLREPLPRERLFRMLDAARSRCKGVFVAAPPGYGKTTLIASWLDARKLKGVWYQLDAGDTDLATFVYYLGLSLHEFRRARQPLLPLLTPDYLGDVVGFMRRYFRDMYARLPDGAVLVLDNYQEIPNSNQFHDLLVMAIEEAPASQCIVVISREVPSENYSRLLLHGDLAAIEMDALRFTPPEANALAKSRLKGGKAGWLPDFYARSEGWAAGLTLMMESASSTTTASSQFGDDEALFGYFATQVFRNLPDEARVLLMVLAELRQVAASVAQAVNPTIDASTVLEGLYKRHLFVHRRASSERTYWFHALFRDFLLKKSAQFFSDKQQRHWQIRLGKALARRDEYDEAVELFQRARDWPSYERLVLRWAESMLSQGRGQSVRAWINQLPVERLNANPWIRYWLGAAWLDENQEVARQHLEVAYRMLCDVSDTIGRLRCISAIVNTYFYAWTHWQPLDKWIVETEALMATQPRFPSREVEQEVMCSILIATLYRRPDHPLLRYAVDRLQVLNADLADVNRRLSGAIYLLTYFNLTNQPEAGRAVIASTNAWLANPEIRPIKRVWWLNRISTWQGVSGEFEAVQGTVDEVKALCNQYGMRGLEGSLIAIATHEHWATLGLRNFSRATQLTDQMSRSARSHVVSERWLASQARARLGLCTANLALALSEGPACVQGAEETGMVYLQAIALSYFAESLARVRRFAEASIQIAKCRELVRGTCFDYNEPELDLLEGYIALESGDRAGAHLALQTSFQNAQRVRSIWRDPRVFRHVLSRMCAESLAAGIESDYAQNLIKSYQLDPPDSAGMHWPWQIFVRTLGGFEVQVGGNPIVFSGKTPKKPLSLLKAIIAHGPGPVSLARISDDLWPGDDGDAAHHSLAMALQRLRRLLGTADSVLLEGEQLRLNPRRCWVDAVAYMRDHENQEDAHVELSYGGRFLPADTEAAWTVAKREQLHTLFLMRARRQGRLLESERAWEPALHHYLTCLVADELEESFYQGALRCYLNLDQPANGIALWRRWRHLCSIVLSTTPAAETKRLAHQLNTPVHESFPDP